MGKEDDKLYVVLLSVHGLIRGHDLELGRDADTGGQVTYVVELARALAEHPRVDRVDLVTRRVIDAKISDDYAAPEEELAPGAHIVRLPCGPKRYLRKETLWPYLDELAGQVMQHFRRIGRRPTVIHSHYADAGYVATQIAPLLGVPLVHTGHSLGRPKRERLLAKGVNEERLEKRYHISRRIAAEEKTLARADRVVTSTRQEVEEQYSDYEHYEPAKFIVLPPGLELGRFRPPGRRFADPPIQEEIDRFLRQPQRPVILALARPDPRKNLDTLIEAYGASAELQEAANLALVVGNRDAIREMSDKQARQVYTRMLELIDRHDLYGRVAYPKHHRPEDVPDLYRLAAKRRGVFVNPALTEPFGLTLIEAAASGLPLVATEDGGPQEILAHCDNGLLVDPLDRDALATALLEALSDRRRWRRWAKRGVKGAKKHYSWPGHVERYLKEVRKLLRRRRPHPPLLAAQRMLVFDLDDTLFGDREAVAAFLERLAPVRDKVLFGVATGRHLDSARHALAHWGVPSPDLFITSVGSEIHYYPGGIADDGWRHRIDHRWERQALAAAMDEEVPGLTPQEEAQQRPFKLSYDVSPEDLPDLGELRRRLGSRGLSAQLIYSHSRHLDLLPPRASKGKAVAYLAAKWGIDPAHVLVAGNSGNDADLLKGPYPAVVVGNYSAELARLRSGERVLFAEGHNAWGIVEALDHYHFFDGL